MRGWSFFQKLRVNARKRVVESESELLNHFHFHFESFLDICFVIWCRDTTYTFFQHEIKWFNSIQFSSTHDVCACSFVAKLSWKKKHFFFWKIFCFLQNIHYLEKKIFLYEKKVLYWKLILLKKTFFTEKNIYIHSAKKLFWSQKVYLLKLRGELNNLVFKVLEAPNLWYSLIHGTIIGTGITCKKILL